MDKYNEWVKLFSKDNSLIEKVCSICDKLCEVAEENDHIKYIEIWGRLNDKEKLLVPVIQSFMLNSQDIENDNLKLKIKKTIELLQIKE